MPVVDGHPGFLAQPLLYWGLQLSIRPNTLDGNSVRAYPGWRRQRLTGGPQEAVMSLILLILVLLIVFGGLPNWGYHNYGYGPSGIGGIILIILIILLLTGRLNF